MLILGIETTCDETACAVVKDGQYILSNVIATQFDIHQKYGGVFPELAARRHIDVIIPVIDQALRSSFVSHLEIDAIAVANGPGLMGSLLVGINGAKGLSLGWNKPLIGVNHVEAHVYSAMMDNMNILQFPAIGVVVSGGHTFIWEILSIGKYRLLGTTVDDALGESFDKVASMLGLSYPGGPKIELLAQEGDENRFAFSAGRVKENPLSFSFSGLKTKVLYTLKDFQNITEQDKKDIAASFQKTAFLDVINKASQAAALCSAKAIYVGGGATNNQKFRKYFEEKSSLPVFWPSKGLSSDNGAMIAGLGYHKYIEKNCKGVGLNLRAHTRISL